MIPDWKDKRISSLHSIISGSGR